MYKFLFKILFILFCFVGCNQPSTYHNWITDIDKNNGMYIKQMKNAGSLCRAALLVMLLLIPAQSFAGNAELLWLKPTTLESRMIKLGITRRSKELVE